MDICRKLHAFIDNCTHLQYRKKEKVLTMIVAKLTRVTKSYLRMMPNTTKRIKVITITSIRNFQAYKNCLKTKKILNIQLKKN